VIRLGVRAEPRSRDEPTLPGSHIGLDPSEAQPPSSSLPPVKVGRYAILEQIGSGAMGVVFAAYDPELDRRVAVKLLAPGRDTEPARERLLAEAQALAKLSHPNVVPIHDAGRHDGRVFLAMEYVRGQTLREFIDTVDRGDPRGWKAVLDVLAGAGRGLAAAHAAGLVHRDFKPQNVLLGEDNRAMVVDFGLATSPVSSASDPEAAIEEGTQSATGNRGPVGTPAYMAPELFDGCVADARTDQFAFCVTLYEALYGTRPFAGEAVPALAYVLRQEEIRAPPPTQRVPLWLHRVVVRGLAAGPGERWSSMDALLTALRRDPRRAWRRRFAVMTVAATVGGIALGTRLRAEDPTCSGSEDAIGRHWNAERRARVSSALLGTGAPYAEDAASVTLERMDAYADAWVEKHRAACEAHRRGERSAALLDVQMACFDRRMQQLGAVVEIFIVADADILRNAANVLESLGSLSACEDLEPHPVEPPPDRIADAVSECRALLIRATAATAAGRYPEAESLLATALNDARELNYAPLLAEVLKERATVARLNGDHPAAARWYDEAWRIAVGAGFDHVATEALISLVHTHGYSLLRYDEAETRAQDARALLERLRRHDAAATRALEPKLWEAEAIVALRQQDQERAIEHLERAMMRYQETLGPEDLSVARVLNALGNATLAAGRYEESLTHYLRVLELRQRQLGALHPALAGIHNNLGIAYKSLQMRELSVEHLEQSLAILEAQLPADHPSVLMAIRNLGNAATSASDWVRAAEYYARYLATFGDLEHCDDAGAADVLVRHSSVLRHLRRDDDARQALEHALRIAQKSGSPLALRQAFIAQGHSLRNTGDIAGAMAAFERSIEHGRDDLRASPGELGVSELELAKLLHEHGHRGDSQRTLELARSAHARLHADPSRWWTTERAQADELLELVEGRAGSSND
jgi:eukaryotic-like serine/threonine-protein kinase